MKIKPNNAYRNSFTVLMIVVAISGCITVPHIDSRLRGVSIDALDLGMSRAKILGNFGSPAAYTIDGQYFLYWTVTTTDWYLLVIGPEVGSFPTGTGISHGMALIAFDHSNLVKNIELHECGNDRAENICEKKPSNALWPMIEKVMGEDRAQQYKKTTELIELRSKPLVQAISNGNLEEIRHQIEQGADLGTIVNERTPLHWAIVQNSFGAVEILVTNGAPVDAPDFNGLTPLHVAAGLGQTAVVELLLTKGADLNLSNVYGETALHLAARNGDTDMAELLISNGALVNAGDGETGTPLHYAIRANQPVIVKQLLASGGHIDAMIKFQGTGNLTALELAEKMGLDDMLDLLEEYGRLNNEEKSSAD